MRSGGTTICIALASEYKTSYPAVTLRIVEAYSGSLVDQLFSGKLDLAVVNNTP